MSATYVQVTALHDTEGNIKPLSLEWIDGRIFEIDRVLDVRKTVSLKAGGWGMRYTCRIMGKQVYLFCVDGKWFVEKQ